jgi:predicted ester cyclase
MRTSSKLLLTLLVICVPAKAQQTRVQERNKEVARSFFEEVLGQGHLDKYAESHAKDFVAHGENHEYTLEEDMAAAEEERKALPDMKVKVNQILAEQDLVAVYWTSSGTNTQAGMGFPATGKKDQD